jgi:quercetin dioxygenase-like cupin family protein
MLLRPDEGERIRQHRVLVELPQIEAFELRFGPDFTVDPHTHADHADSFWVLEGEVEFTAGEETHRAGPGTWFSAPAGVLHGFRTLTDVRLLNIHAPNTGFGEGLRRD